MRYIYCFFVFLFNTSMVLVSPFNRKAKLIIEGRKSTFKTLKHSFSPDDLVAWFHAASLGEFEQGRPLMEAFKEKYPKYKILLTFFSSSGYEIQKNYKGADVVVYLPSDSNNNAKRFVQLANPKYVFFIKYEFWYNFIRKAKLNGARVFQVSLILRESQYFFSRYGSWYRKQLKNFDYFFVQNEKTKQLLSSIGLNNAKVTGDTRFDRVLQIANNKRVFPKIKEFCGNLPVIIMGSSWEKDEELMKEILQKTNLKFKLIIAPHQIHNSHIEQIQTLFPNAIKYSEIETNSSIDLSQINVLIINSIGILSSLYQYATIAYIGGGFGVGIHNILEAATFGKPICFGINYHKFKEAIDLVELSGAFSINNADQLKELIERLLLDKAFYNRSSDVCIKYIEDNVGACKKILSEIHMFEQKELDEK